MAACSKTAASHRFFSVAAPFHHGQDEKSHGHTPGQGSPRPENRSDSPSRQSRGATHATDECLSVVLRLVGWETAELWAMVQDQDLGQLPLELGRFVKIRQMSRAPQAESSCGWYPWMAPRIPGIDPARGTQRICPASSPAFGPPETGRACFPLVIGHLPPKKAEVPALPDLVERTFFDIPCRVCREQSATSHAAIGKDAAFGNAAPADEIVASFGER